MERRLEDDVQGLFFAISADADKNSDLAEEDFGHFFDDNALFEA